MRYWALLLIILAAAIIQISVLDALRVFNVKPDLLLACVVALSLSLELRFSVIFSAFAGMLKDLIGVNPLALNLLLFPFWSVLIIYAAKKMSLESAARRTVLIFSAAFVNILACRLFLFSASAQIPFGIFARTLLLESAYTTLLAQGAFIFISNRFPLREAFKQDRGPDLESEID